MESNSKKSVSNLVKRALCYALTTVMVISGFNMVPMSKITAEAAPGGYVDGAPLEKGYYKLYPISNTALALGSNSSAGANAFVNYENGKGALVSPNDNGSYKRIDHSLHRLKYMT